MDFRTLKDILEGYGSRGASREEINSQLLPYLEELYKEAQSSGRIPKLALEETLKYIQGTAFESLCLLSFIPHAIRVAFPKPTLEVQEVMDKSSFLWEQMQSAL